MKESSDEPVNRPALTDIPAEERTEAGKAHRFQVAVWDLPPAIECGTRFNAKIGVKCSNGCRPAGWSLEIIDHNRKKLVSATPGEEPLPNTAALYYAEVELIAPATEGRFRWEARAIAESSEIPHDESAAEINLRVVAEPECVLTIEAIDRERRTPVEGARVVIHPYRTLTDRRGLAVIRVPKGEHRLFVSGRNYFPFRQDSSVNTDMRIRAELVVDRELSDEDLWI